MKYLLILFIFLIGCNKNIVKVQPKISIHQRIIDSLCPSHDCTVTASYPEYERDEWEVKTKVGDSSYYIHYILWDCMDGSTLYDSNLYSTSYIVWKDYYIWEREHEHLFDIN